jgi:hypothetical protein
MIYPLLRRRVVLLVTLCAAIVGASSAAAPSVVAQKRSLDVVLSETGVEDERDSRVLWVGMRNEQRRAILMCIASWDYQVIPKSAVARPTLEVTSIPHACQVQQAFTIVNSGETLFVPLIVRSPEWQDDAEFRIGIRLSARLAPSSPANVTELTWRGTVGEASAGGRRIFPRPRV